MPCEWRNVYYLANGEVRPGAAASENKNWVIEVGKREMEITKDAGGERVLEFKTWESKTAMLLYRL